MMHGQASRWLRRTVPILGRARLYSAEATGSGGGRAKWLLAASAVGGAAGFAALSKRDGPVVALARVDEKLRPCLVAVLPHEVFVWLYSSSRTIFLKALARSSVAEVDGERFPHPCSALGMCFRGDLGNAAGLDKDGALLDFNFRLGAGFAVVGTVLSAPHTGNVFSMLGGLWKGNVWTPLPASGGALNSLGLPGYGVDLALENLSAFRARHGVAPMAAGDGDERPLVECFPIGVSIMGHPAQQGQAQLEGVVECVRKAIPLADFIEINESCPNVKHGHGSVDALRDRLAAVVAARDQAARAQGRRVPILVKLGDLGDAAATVKFLAKLGIDGLVALNTQRDYASFHLPDGDKQLLEHYTGKHGGGLSGPPIRERSLQQVEAATAAVAAQGLAGRFTVVHVGGLVDTGDVRRSRATGAELRAWYTGLMHNLAAGGWPGEVYRKVAAA